MHLLLRTTLLLRLGDVMRVDACERHSEYSRVVHGLVPPRSLTPAFTNPRSMNASPLRVGQEQSRRESKDFQIVRRLEPDPGWKLLLLELICVKTERRVVDQHDTQVEKFDENRGKAAL